jgi:hypothetical protein
MSKEFGVIDLLSKLSTNSFLLQFENEKTLITPGIYLNMPGKFYLYVDILDTVMRNLYVNGKGDVVVSIEDLQQNLKPVDLNEYFTKLEKSIRNVDVLGLNEQKQYPVGDVKVVENTELPQPTTPTIGELEPNEKTEQNKSEEKKQTEEKKLSEEKETGETEQTKQKTYTKKQYGYQKSGYNRTYTRGNTYQKSGYSKNSANSNTYTSGRKYNEYYKKSEE